MITPEMLREWGSPWSLEQLVPLYAGRQSLTIHEILANDGVHVSHMVGVVGKWLEHVGSPTWVMTDAAVRQWAPDVLEVKGFTRHAAELRDLPEIVDVPTALYACGVADRVRVGGMITPWSVYASCAAQHAAMTGGTSTGPYPEGIAQHAAAARLDPAAIRTTLLEIADRSFQ